jgi:hypothetical protein
LTMIERIRGISAAMSAASVDARSLPDVIAIGFEKKNRDTVFRSSPDLHVRAICADIVDFPVPA